MSDDLEPLAPSLRALLDAGAEGPPAPERVRERLLHRVETTVGVAPERAPASVIPIAPAAGRGGRPAREGDDATWGAPDSDYVASAVGYTPRTPGRLLPMLAGVFVLGAAAGAALVYGVLRSERSASPVAHTVTAPEEAPTPATETAPRRPTQSHDPAHDPSLDPAHDPVTAPAPAHVGPAESADPEPHGAPPAFPSAARDGALAAERALVETARAALARADANAALTTLQRHARQFPNGVLAEEREALAVQALAKTGDAAAAKSRGERFLQRFPRSLFVPIVEDAMQGD
ncbi:outer membrane protein assembly factor BamD [Pendulispora albinea]|uniref:Outer membrane lipoprotein BamD-like domain-containing protein n=1 Tax=Pendulispora albinea TaxID=2741071 RepID=A0ABZ2LU87_9BACT